MALNCRSAEGIDIVTHVDAALVQKVFDLSK